MTQRQLVSLGMFIVDQLLFEDEDGNPTERNLDPQVGLCRYDGDGAPPFCGLVAHLSLLLYRENRSGVELIPQSELGSGQSLIPTIAASGTSS